MTTVLTGGKFNRIHEGHLFLLKKAKKLGDRLVVVLAHDSHNKREYALPAEDRKKQLEETGIPDDVVTGDPSDYSKVIEKYEPDIIVLGYDQELPEGIVEKIKAIGKNIKIVKLGQHENHKTRDL